MDQDVKHFLPYRNIRILNPVLRGWAELSVSNCVIFIPTTRIFQLNNNSNFCNMALHVDVLSYVQRGYMVT
jgi:hypothetical protein